MPGMDGFQFISRAREDQRDIPSVLVTSRNSADDRRRGAEAGARAYIVKSDFHQGHFLETIARLLGVANA
jgi:CheY-like chemotaxis protein